MDLSLACGFYNILFLNEYIREYIKFNIFYSTSLNDYKNKFINVHYSNLFYDDIIKMFANTKIALYKFEYMWHCRVNYTCFCLYYC